LRETGRGRSSENRCKKIELQKLKGNPSFQAIEMDPLNAGKNFYAVGIMPRFRQTLHGAVSK
jgi:hypothetical protein